MLKAMLVNLTLDDWANISTIMSPIIAIVGTIIAVAVLFYTAYQIHQNTKISHGQFWLELEKMFSQHDEVHLKLRPSGDWRKENTGPKDNIEWMKVDDYMGLFEQCEIMLGKKLIDWETFKAIYSYRLDNIVANKCIVQKKLIEEKADWENFIKLLNRLRQSRAAEPDHSGVF